MIVDLDGPLLDGSWRHYECYRRILAEHALTPLELETYWRLKRHGACLRDQLAATGGERIYDAFKTAWLERIEAPDLLRLDRVQPNAAETLQRWHAIGAIRLVLATLRQSEAGVREQLEHVGLSSIWDSIAVCAPQSGIGKARMVQDALGRTDGRDCVWIGDTEVDVHAARSFGCPVWAVSCGVRDRAFLEALSPDRLSSSIAEVDLSAYMPTGPMA